MDNSDLFQKVKTQLSQSTLDICRGQVGKWVVLNASVLSSLTEMLLATLPVHCVSTCSERRITTIMCWQVPNKVFTHINLGYDSDSGDR